MFTRDEGTWLSVLKISQCARMTYFMAKHEHDNGVLELSHMLDAKVTLVIFVTYVNFFLMSCMFLDSRMRRYI